MTVYMHEFHVTVLSEDPVYDPESLEQIHHDINEEHMIGELDHERSFPLEPNQARAMLIAIGNDGTFFDEL